MSDAAREDMAMLKRMRLVRKKLKEVPFSLCVRGALVRSCAPAGTALPHRAAAAVCRADCQARGYSRLGRA